MAVWLIAWANIKRKRGVALSMGLLVMLAVSMLNVGITLLTGIGGFYERANDEMNGAHYTVRFAANAYKDEYLDFFLGDSRVAEAETEEVIIMDMATFPDGGALSANFFRLENGKPVNGCRIQKLAGVPEEQAVYIPEFLKEKNFMPGDAITLIFKKQPYTFYVAGYSQSTWFHSSASTIVNFYMPEKAFEHLYSQVGGGYYMAVRVFDLDDIPALRQDFQDQTDVKIEAATLESAVMDFSVDEMKNGATMVVSILSAILLAFSILIIMVAMLAIRFRIINHIETQMHNIGALGALGYTGKQIRQSIALEFLFVGLVGSLCGILVSYGLIGGLSTLITHSVGVAWKAGGHISADVASCLLVMMAVLLVTQASAWKAARILPVQALRGGLYSHNFSKNYFPLDRAGKYLTGALGFKHIMYQLKTYLMVAIVFIGVTFALASAAVFYWNMGINDEFALDMSGYEISDILVYAAPHADYDELVQDIEQMDEVRKTSLYETTSVRVENSLVMCYLSDDYGKMETVRAYEGYLPEYSNEIMLTGVLADSLGKQIGDTVEVTAGGITSEYIICGLAQTMSNFGKQCYMNLSGLTRINPTYRPGTVQVYLNPGVEAGPFISKMEEAFHVLSPSSEGSEGQELMTAKRKAEEKLAALLSMYGVDSAQYALMKDGEIVLSGDTSAYQIDKIENNRQLFISNVDSITASVRLVTVMILLGTILIIALVFYMVIKSMIVRRSREFGIYKALGYTDRQLMEQVAVSFVPSVLSGIVSGCILTAFSINHLSSLLFRGIGISQLAFEINGGVLFGMGACLTAYSFMICMAVAWRIRKISAYELMIE